MDASTAFKWHWLIYEGEDVISAGLNMGFFFSNIGIIMATGLMTALKATALSEHALFPGGECPAHAAHLEASAELARSAAYE